MEVELHLQAENKFEIIECSFETIEFIKLTTDAPLIANEMDLTISNKQAYAIDIP